MADFNSKYSGEQVESLLDYIANGGEVPEGGGAVGSDVYVTTFTVEALRYLNDNPDTTISVPVDIINAITEKRVILVPDTTAGLGYVVATYAYGVTVDGTDAMLALTLHTRNGDVISIESDNSIEDDNTIILYANDVSIEVANMPAYIADDITMGALEDVLYAGQQLQCDTQSLANAIRTGKRVFIKSNSDNSIYGLLPLNGVVDGEDITFSVMSQNAEIFLCWVNENSMSIDPTNIRLVRETASAPFSWQGIEYLVEYADGDFSIGRDFLDAISNDCIIRIENEEGGFIVASQCSGYRDGSEAGFSMRFAAPDNKVYNISVDGSLDEDDRLIFTHEHITVETMATVGTVNQAIADAITEAITNTINASY